MPNNTSTLNLILFSILLLLKLLKIPMCKFNYMLYIIQIYKITFDSFYELISNLMSQIIEKLDF